MAKSKKTFSKVWTDSNEKDWLVKYYFDGAFYPGSQEDLPEYPELVIDQIRDEDGNDFGEETEEIILFIQTNHDNGEYEF